MKQISAGGSSARTAR